MEIVPHQPILDKLTQFQQRDIFSTAAWEARGLNPSGEHVSGPLRSLLKACAEQLSAAVATGKSQDQQKKILTSALSSLNKTGYDTEEREFIADLFMELATIVGLDIKNTLNQWLYGPLLSAIFSIGRFLRPERIITTLRQSCTQCGTQLETHILRKQSGIPDYDWIVAKCNQCGELNLISTGSNIKEKRFVNYQWIDSLPKDEYTYEQALIRVQQIKYFRKT